MSQSKTSRKGQVTVFIILGLVLIIGLALYFYLTAKQTTPQINIPRLAGDAGDVQTFVEGCINQVAREGLIELGRHGGYIDPLDIEYSLTTFDYDKIAQTESDLTFLDTNDETTSVPYWYYSRSGRNCWHCQVSSAAPSLELMSYQLGLYVDNHLEQCLNNFNVFKDRGIEIMRITNASTETIIKPDSEGFLTDYIIQISKNSEVSKIEKFYTEVDIPLLQYYATAAKITQSEIDNEYLDFFGLYLLGQYMGMDSKKFPPFSAYTVGYDTKFWSKTNTRRLFESQLRSYTSFLRINGTINDVNILEGLPLESRMYTATNLPIFTDTEKKSLDIKTKEINYIYNGQQIYLNVVPSNGDLISPFVAPSNGGGGILSSIEPDQSYEFYYDISYPVIVEIKDTRPNKDYSFLFALQGNIKQNKMLSDWISGKGTIPWDYDYVNMFSDVPIGTQNEDIETGEIYTFEAPKASKTLFCDEAQRLSGNVRLKTYDASTSKPLDGVRVSYKCGTYASCDFGNTIYNNTLDESLFNKNLPICANGYIQLDKEGFLSKRVPLTTEYNRPEYLGSLYMDRLFTLNVTVQKIVLSWFNGYVFNEPINLTSNDSVTISLEKLTTDEWDEPWSQTVLLGKDGLNDTQIQLAPGLYTVEAQLMDYNGVVIPKECQEIKKPGKNIKIPEDNIVISVAMWGGAKFDEFNPVAFNSDDLSNNQNIMFRIVRMPNPKCINDMDVSGKVLTLSKTHKQQLYPILS